MLVNSSSLCPRSLLHLLHPWSLSYNLHHSSIVTLAVRWISIYRKPLPLCQVNHFAATTFTWPFFFFTQHISALLSLPQSAHFAWPFPFCFLLFSLLFILYIWLSFSHYIGSVYPLIVSLVCMFLLLLATNEWNNNATMTFIFLHSFLVSAIFLWFLFFVFFGHWSFVLKLLLLYLRLFVFGVSAVWFSRSPIYFTFSNPLFPT